MISFKINVTQEGKKRRWRRLAKKEEREKKEKSTRVRWRWFYRQMRSIKEAVSLNAHAKQTLHIPRTCLPFLRWIKRVNDSWDWGWLIRFESQPQNRTTSFFLRFALQFGSFKPTIRFESHNSNRESCDFNNIGWKKWGRLSVLKSCILRYTSQG